MLLEAKEYSQRPEAKDHVEKTRFTFKNKQTSQQKTFVRSQMQLISQCQAGGRCAGRTELLVQRLGQRRPHQGAESLVCALTQGVAGGYLIHT